MNLSWAGNASSGSETESGTYFLAAHHPQSDCGWHAVETVFHFKCVPHSAPAPDDAMVIHAMGLMALVDSNVFSLESWEMAVAVLQARIELFIWKFAMPVPTPCCWRNLDTYNLKNANVRSFALRGFVAQGWFEHVRSSLGFL